VGGIWGYYGFLESMQDPNHPEHERLKEWIGGGWDPDAFDMEAVNQDLRAIVGAEELLQPIDRCAVIVRPKQRFLDWVNSTMPPGETVTMEYLQEDCRTYLLPPVDHFDEARELLEPIHSVIFVLELMAWYEDSSLWPAAAETKDFDEWFEIEVHSGVYDLVEMAIAVTPELEA
jgi:hypothetical protein